MHRIGAEKAATVDRIHAFLSEGALIDAPQDTIYAEWWKAAHADSFKPATDLGAQRSSTEPDIANN